VRKRSTPRTTRTKPARRPAAPAAERLERQREALLQRLAHLNAAAKLKPGYRTARKLLNSTFHRASLATRAAILQAANFMISILEMTPPF
jgi:hypothetical protein